MLFASLEIRVGGYAYEARTSRLQQRTDPLGQIASRTWTRDDRPATLTYSNTVTATPAVSLAYDPYFPRLTGMTDGNGTTGYQYVPAGVTGALRLASEDGPFANDTLDYKYDSLGRLKTRKIAGVSDTFTYDTLGRVTGHNTPLGNFALSYLGATGQLAHRALTQSGQWTTDWRYGGNLADRRLEAIDHSPGPNQPVARDYAYTTDPENRILGLTESVAGSASATWSYGYDAADRLTNALVSPGGAYGYDLDPGDNPLGIQTPASATTTSYDNLNQIALRNAQPFTWDAAGNLADDGQRTYVWDAEQRLLRIRYTGTSTFTEFRYDGLGRRTAVIDSDGTTATETRYLWCGERLCQARDGADTVTRRYYAEGELAVAATGDVAIFYAEDHLGSIRDLRLGDGQVLASYDYDPYGNPTRTTSTNGIRADYRYAGLFYHAPSGLYLTHYRVYDPLTARWISRDPIGEAGGVNLYGYVFQNPINFYDPLGLRCWTNQLGQSVCDSGSPFAATYCPSGDCAAFPASMNDANIKECMEKCRTEQVWIDIACDVVGSSVGGVAAGAALVIVPEAPKLPATVGFAVEQGASATCGKVVEILVCECDGGISCPSEK